LFLFFFVFLVLDSFSSHDKHIWARVVRFRSFFFFWVLIIFFGLSILWVYGLNVLRLFLLISYKLTLLFVLFAMIEARTYKISFYVINLSIKGLFWINRSLMTFEYLGLGLKLSRMIHAIYNLFLLFDALLYFNLLFFIYFCQWFDEIGFVISI
jgi:hypothetical protein